MNVFQSLPAGFDLEFRPFWMITPEQGERHKKYQHQSNNWLKMHGLSMRRKCMGVKCVRRHPVFLVDEAWQLLGTVEKSDFFHQVMSAGRKHGDAPLESFKGVLLGLPVTGCEVKTLDMKAVPPNSITFGHSGPGRAFHFLKCAPSSGIIGTFGEGTSYYERWQKLKNLGVDAVAIGDSSTPKDEKQ